MWEDLQQLWSEFDLQMLTRPQGPDQFIFALIIVAIMGALLYVAIKLLFSLLS